MHSSLKRLVRQNAGKKNIRVSLHLDDGASAQRGALGRRRGPEAARRGRRRVEDPVDGRSVRQGPAHGLVEGEGVVDDEIGHGAAA